MTVGDRATLEIRGIASDPDSANVITVKNFRDLPSVKMDLVEAICDGMFGPFFFFSFHFSGSYVYLV